ncbi:MAG: hypothetical protein CMJ19_18660 [Phycisphaeraceae bacterium]|nr:hypothetical protein [Phycisphaeraceae bacterium]|tara:strand:- start:75 stop:404 length:330 start_codon:yes stop_codon:yes gene_type:complete
METPNMIEETEALVAPKKASRVEIIVQSVLGVAIIAVLTFFTAVQMGAFDQSAKMAEYAKPLTGNDVVKMLSQNENTLRKSYANYDQMMARAKARGEEAFFSASTNVEN